MLYIIHAKGTTDVKIGYTSRSASERLDEMKGHCPNELAVVWEGVGTMDDEKALHRALSKHKRRGEWFSVTRDMVDDLTRAASRSVADAIRHVMYEKPIEYKNQASVSGLVSKVVQLSDALTERGYMGLVIDVCPDGSDRVKAVVWPQVNVAAGDPVRVSGSLFLAEGGMYISGRLTVQ